MAYVDCFEQKGSEGEGAEEKMKEEREESKFTQALLFFLW